MAPGQKNLSRCRLFRDLARDDHIQVTPSQRPDLDAEFVSTRERTDIADLVDDATLGLEFRHIVDHWADRRLGEMLDYVYFYTEPMETAQRGELLDFSRAQREERHLELPGRQVVDPRAARRLKQEVSEERPSCAANQMNVSRLRTTTR